MRGTRRAWIAATVLALSVAAAPEAAGAAITSFGADLTAEANDPAVCGEGFYPTFVASQSCTWASGAPGASFYAPASGTVTAVRVRVGAVSGPMQVVVMRSIYQNRAGDPEHPYFSCCFVESYGPVFQPSPGTVTTVASSLAMTEQPTPPPSDVATKAIGDFLAISVLAPGVPLPAFIDEQSSDAGFYPSPTPAGLTAPSLSPLIASATPTGAEMLLDADLQTPPGPVPQPVGSPSGAGGGGGGGGSTAAPPRNAPARVRRAAPAIALVAAAITVPGATVAVPLQCLAAACTGTLALESMRPARLARTRRSAARQQIFGTARFALRAGASATVTVRLRPAARRMLRRRGRLGAWATVTFSGGVAAPSSEPITLRR